MRRPSFSWSEKTPRDGSASSPIRSPELNGSSTSYFSLNLKRSAKETFSEDSSAESPFFASVYKLRKSTITTEESNSPKSQPPIQFQPATPNVQDWNVTRLFDVKPDKIETPPTPPMLTTYALISPYSPTSPRAPSDNLSNPSRRHFVRPKPRQQTIDPPRPARDGCEWVWFPEGYWAERERKAYLDQDTDPRGRKSSKCSGWFKPPDRTSNDSEDSWASTSPRSSRIYSKQTSGVSIQDSNTGSVTSSKSRASRIFNKMKTLSPTYPNYTSPEGMPEGLFCKTKRKLAVPFAKSKKNLHDEETSANLSRVPSSTTILLDAAAEYFERPTNSMEDVLCRTPSSVTSTETKRRWKLGLAPWHRRLSDMSLMSVSSSVYELLMGKTPVGTPRSEAKYFGAKGKLFVKVEISEPDAPSFLPSEARRFLTPPGEPTRANSPDMLPSSIARVDFFQRIRTPPREPTRANSPDMLPSSIAQADCFQQRSLDLRAPVIKSRNTSRATISKWFDHNPLRRSSMDNECGRPKSNSMLHSSRTSPNERSHFVFSIPDHLPNSPLCPTNPKHTSKGNGICPMHGRKKSLSPVSHIEITVSSDH